MPNGALAEAAVAAFPRLTDPEFRSLAPDVQEQIIRDWYAKQRGQATTTTLPPAVGATPAPGQPPPGLTGPLELLRGVGRQVGEAIIGPEEQLSTTDPYGTASVMARGLIRTALTGATLGAVPPPTPEQVPRGVQIPVELAGAFVAPIGGIYRGAEKGLRALGAGKTLASYGASATAGAAFAGGAAAIREQPIYPAAKAGAIVGLGLRGAVGTGAWIYNALRERATKVAGDADFAAKLDFLTKQEAEFTKPEPLAQFLGQPTGIVGSGRELRALHGPIVDTDPRRAILTVDSVVKATSGEQIVLGKGQPVIIEGVRNDNALLVRFEDRGQSAVLPPSSLQIIPQAVVAPGVPAQQVIATAKGPVVVTKKVSDTIPQGLIGQIESIDSAGNATIRLASGETQVVPAKVLRFTGAGEVRYGGVGPIERPGTAGAREIRQGPFTLQPQAAEDVIQFQAGSALPPAPKAIPAVPSKITVLRGVQALPEWPPGSAHGSIVGPAELEKAYLDTVRRRINATLRKDVRQLAKQRADELLKQGKSGEPLPGDVELLDPTGFKQSIMDLEQQGGIAQGRPVPPLKPQAREVPREATPWGSSALPPSEQLSEASLSEIRGHVLEYLRGATYNNLLGRSHGELKRVGNLVGATVYDARYRAPSKEVLAQKLLAWRDLVGVSPRAAPPDAVLRDRMKLPMSYDELKAVREKAPPIDEPPVVGKDVTLQMGVSPHQITDTMKQVAGTLHREFGSPYEILGRHEKGNRLWRISFEGDRNKSMFLSSYSDWRKSVVRLEGTPQYEEAGILAGLADRNRWDMPKDLPTAIQQRFTPEVIEEWSRMRQAFDIGRQIAERDRPEVVGKLTIPGYMHHVFDQEQRILALQTEQVGLELLRKHGQLSTLEASRLKLITDTLEAGFRGRYVPADVIPQNLTIGFLQKRTGAEGYSLDYGKALDSYYLQLARMVYDEPALKQMAALGARIEPGVIRDYAQWYIRRWYFGERDQTGLDTLARAITGFEFLWRIGGNFRTAVQNGTQHLNTIGKIGPRWTAKGFQEAFTEEGERLWAKSGHATDVDKIFWYELPPKIKKLTDAAGWMFRKVETGNRKVAYLGAYNQALAEGNRIPFIRKLLAEGYTSEQAAAAWGDEIVMSTQFLYGRVGTSKMLGTAGGRVTFQFGSYSVKQMEYLYGLFKDNPAKLFTYLMANGGINYGIYQGLGLDFSTALGLGMGYSDGLNALSSLMTGDIEQAKYYGKLAVAPIYGGGGLFPSGPGPFIRDLIALKNMETDQLIQTQLKRFIEVARALPEGLRTGNYPIFEQITGDRSDVLRVRLSGTELIARTFIARSATEEKEIRERRALRYSQDALEQLYQEHPELAPNPQARARGKILRENLTPSERRLLQNKYPSLYRQYLER